jgi:hypothetical protein
MGGTHGLVAFARFRDVVSAFPTCGDDHTAKNLAHDTYCLIFIIPLICLLEIRDIVLSAVVGKAVL